MKVLYLTNIPSPYRVSFFNELGKLCDLTVLFERKQSEGRDQNWHDYNFSNFRGVFLKGINFKKNQLISLGFLKYVSKKEYDVIVVGGYSTPTGLLTICYLNLKKIPFILNIDGGLINTEENKIMKKIKTFFISTAKGWLSTGEVGDKYLKHYGAKSSSIYHYPFTSVNKKDLLHEVISVSEKERLKQKLGVKGDKVAISVGSFIPRKGFETLIKAWRYLEEIHLYIIGGQPTQEYLDLIDKYKIKNIHFEEFKPKDELFEFYQASDIFVFPTLQDIWGLVVNEALVNGLPIITTSECVAGLELIENNVNGYIIPPNDEESIVTKVKQITENKALSELMSKNNILKAKKYTIENMAKVTHDILLNEKNDNSF